MGDVQASPVFQYCDRLKLNKKFTPASAYDLLLLRRLTKSHKIKCVRSLCKYIDTNIERKLFKKTYNEIVSAEVSPFDKSKCDPESAVLLFLLKKLRNGMIVRDTTCLNYFDEITDNNIFSKYLDVAISSRSFVWGFMHAKVFNYIYVKYIESYYDYLMQCFLYDQPCEFPKTARDEVRDDMCEFPAYLMFDNEYIVYLYKGSE